MDNMLQNCNNRHKNNTQPHNYWSSQKGTAVFHRSSFSSTTQYCTGAAAVPKPKV